MYTHSHPLVIGTVASAVGNPLVKAANETKGGEGERAKHIWVVCAGWRDSFSKLK